MNTQTSGVREMAVLAAFCLLGLGLFKLLGWEIAAAWGGYSFLCGHYLGRRSA